MKMNRSALKSIVRTMIGITVVIGFAACSFGGSGDGGGSPSDSPASRTLRDMPEIEAQLPASLASGGTTGSGSVAAAAVDDVTEVVASQIPDVKAQGWYDMKDAAGLDFLTEAFVDELREIADERALDFNTVYTIGQRDFVDGQYDLGRLKLLGSENDMTVYWFARPFPGTGFWARIHIVKSGDDWSVTATMNQYSDASSGWGESTLLSYADFDTATGESLLLLDDTFTDPGFGTERWQEITVSVPNSDGSLTVLSEYALDGDAGWSEMRIGWGDDSMGGVLGIGEDGSSAFKEFYDGNGSLLQQSWGYDSLLAGGISWIESEGFNLADVAGFSPAPNTVYVFSVWNGVNDARYVSADNALDVVTDTEIGQTWGLYYKGGDFWASGDALYNWNSGDAYDDGDLSTWVWREEYTLGYQVPTADSFFGGSYYFEDRYPFKHLLPLVDPFAGNTVRKKEGETFSDSWIDEDSGETETWSWTDYQYFIDVDDDGALDPGGENPDVILDGVWMSENWVWDSANQQEIKVRAPFLTTTGGNLPGYFDFVEANQEIVDAVELRITDIYDTDFAGLSFDAYSSNLEDIRNAPEFDDVEF